MKVDIDGESHIKEKCLKTKRSFKKRNSLSNDAILHRGAAKSKKWTRDLQSEVLHINDDPLLMTTEECEATGIITLEDVIEELLQVCAIISSMKFYPVLLSKNLFSVILSNRRRSMMRLTTMLKLINEDPQKYIHQKWNIQAASQKKFIFIWELDYLQGEAK